jgi:hypothetical protein
MKPKNSKPPLGPTSLGAITALSFLLLAPHSLKSQTLTQTNPQTSLQPELTLPTPDNDGRWETTHQETLNGRSFETKIWKNPDKPEKNPIAIQIELTPFNPTPNLSEVARTYEVAAKRASYATTVKTTETKDKATLIEYTNPQENRTGILKIFALPQGLLTIKAQTSLPQPPSWETTRKIIQETSTP